ncbi:MAG: ribosome recycling factor [Bacteroidetes bacterium]|nr:MAG: ribosome recycling factor [Bacteroidota bacterium]RLD85352.1 MAG: ribosome recycling factor [Bacteroidota bacterium]
MNEEVDLILEDAEDNMKNAISHLEKALIKIRAGQANPSMLEGLQVDYYGSMTPVGQVANIGTSDARTIVIQPWEKQMIVPIEKAIMAANLGFNPDNNGEVIRINIPMLTEERRMILVKQVKHEGEETKISLRSSRRDANEMLKKMKDDGLSEDMEKRAQDEVQKLTDDYYSKVEGLIEEKEKDIMTV